MSLRGVSIKDGSVGANSNEVRAFGLVGNGVAVEGSVQLGTAYKLLRPSDAVAIGITAAYDKAYSVNVYRHISEFYRRAGEGIALHIILVAQTVKPESMVESAKILAVEAEGAISDFGFVYNVPKDYEPVLVDGLETDIKAAIPVLQGFVDWAAEHDMPCHTILEGRGISDTLSSLTDLRALKVGAETLEAEKVTLVVGQDWTYADSLWATGKKFADVGTFLGVIASQDWNRNPGEQATQNLTNATKGIWTVGGLSNHKKYSEVYDSLETMDAKGYVFPIKYTGVSGYFWNDGHCCCPIKVDDEGNMNQYEIYYSHTIDESKRALRAVYLPEVKSTVLLDAGKLPASKVDYYDSIGDLEFDKLAGKGLISGGSTATDPDSDLITAKRLNIAFKVVPTGCVGEIAGTINLSNS